MPSSENPPPRVDAADADGGLCALGARQRPPAAARLCAGANGQRDDRPAARAGNGQAGGQCAAAAAARPRQRQPPCGSWGWARVEALFDRKGEGGMGSRLAAACGCICVLCVHWSWVRPCRLVSLPRRGNPLTTPLFLTYVQCSICASSNRACSRRSLPFPSTLRTTRVLLAM